MTTFDWSVSKQEQPSLHVDHTLNDITVSVMDCTYYNKVPGAVGLVKVCLDCPVELDIDMAE